MGTRPDGSVFGENSFYRETRGTRRGGCLVVKRSSDPRIAHPEVKVQVRDLVRVVGIFSPMPRGGSVFGENSFYRALAGRWAQETCAVCPQQRFITGEPGKVQGRDSVVIVSSPAVQYSEKIRLIEKPGIQDEGGRHVVKRRSDPRIAHPEVKVQVRDLVRVGIFALFAPRGFSIRGKFVLSSPSGKMGTVDLFARRDRVGIVEGSCGYRTRRVSIHRKFVLSRNPGYKTRGRLVDKRRSEPRVAHPDVKVQVRDLVRFWVFLPCLPHGGSVFGESSFYRDSAGRWAQ